MMLRISPIPQCFILSEGDLIYTDFIRRCSHYHNFTTSVTSVKGIVHLMAVPHFLRRHPKSVCYVLP